MDYNNTSKNTYPIKVNHMWGNVIITTESITENNPKTNKITYFENINKVCCYNAHREKDMKYKYDFYGTSGKIILSDLKLGYNDTKIQIDNILTEHPGVIVSKHFDRYELFVQTLLTCVYTAITTVATIFLLAITSVNSGGDTTIRTSKGSANLLIMISNIVGPVGVLIISFVITIYFLVKYILFLIKKSKYTKYTFK